MGAQLSRAERLSLTVARTLNERSGLKRAQQVWLLQFNQRWVRHAIGHRLLADNIEWLLEPPVAQGGAMAGGGVVLALNHRSFFDAYSAMFALYHSGATWPRRLFFPVRSSFFYESPLGVAVNVLLGGGALYPPIFRDHAKSHLNRDALDRMGQFLRHEGTLVGIHPEGTRGKGPDPYTLLPAQTGIGQVVLSARPLVVPAFIGGLSNSVGQVVRDTHSKDARSLRPIIVTFGAPVDYSDLLHDTPRIALYKQCADRIRDAILELGRRERAVRAECTAGEIGDDDPRWVANRARAATARRR